MNKKIGYLTFGRDDFGYGLNMVLSEIPYPLYRVTPKTARFVDILVFSLFWWEHLYLLADFLRKAGIDVTKKNRRPIIYIGGFNTFNPMPLMPYADAVIVGDGEDLLKDLIDDPDLVSDHIFRGEEYGDIIYRSVPAIHPIPHLTGDIARIEIARGCKYHCAFCAVSHHKPYREASLRDITQCLSRVSAKRVSLFAPEPSLHSRATEIQKLCERYGKIRMDSDLRLDRLEKQPQHGRNVPRVGLEGLSERLRRSVKKPYSDSFVLDKIHHLVKKGHSGLFLYLILDLPGEQKEDWDAFRHLLERIGDITSSYSFVLKPSPSVFMPTPGTPMAYEPIHFDRDYRSLWKAFFNRDGRSWEVTMAERTRVFAPAMRILSMLATRGGREVFEIERRLSAKKIIRIQSGRVRCHSYAALLAVLDQYGGADRWCGRIAVDDAPWKRVKFSARHN